MDLACEICGRKIDERRAIRVVLEESEVIVCSPECRDAALEASAIDEIVPSRDPSDRR